MSKTRVGISKQLFRGSLTGPELDDRPLVIENEGLLAILEELDCEVVSITNAELTPAENETYGARYRTALASYHQGEHVSKMIKDNVMPIGLLSNCIQLMGMLAGHQRSGPSWKPLRVGLIWMDAHGDFNTPETSLSGMVGGMPVAISTGLCLHHIRRASGLEPPLPMSYITMLGVRDTDPGEQYLIDTHNIPQITTKDVKTNSYRITGEIERLAALTDLIYVHIDLDILDPSVMPGLNTPVDGGPNAEELSKTLETIFKHPKVEGLGLASYPANNDPDRVGLKSIFKLVEGAIKGRKNRS
jgi:arginase